MEATLNAYDHFHEVGGGLNLVYINGEGSSHKERYFELFDAPMQLAKEAVVAKNQRLITKKQCYTIIDEIIFKRRDLDTVEKKLFGFANDINLLRKLLRGYKFPPFPIAGETPAKGKKPSGKGAKK